MSGVFISYRRDRGSELARLLKEALESRRFDVFLDVDDLGAGHFDRKLLAQIESRENFVLVCTEGCLDRCTEAGDFLRAEIAHALATGRNIVPIRCLGFAWPDGKLLPEDIRDLQRHNDIEYSHRHWESARDNLLQQMRREHRDFRITLETAAARFEPCRAVLAGLVEAVRGRLRTDMHVEIRQLSPRATSADPREGLVASMRAANLLLIDVASPDREEMLFRAGLATGLGIDFMPVSSDPRDAPPIPRPVGFVQRSAPCLAAGAPRHELEHLRRFLEHLMKQHAER